jgi:hypothetical protein
MNRPSREAVAKSLSLLVAAGAAACLAACSSGVGGTGSGGSNAVSASGSAQLPESDSALATDTAPPSSSAPVTTATTTVTHTSASHSASTSASAVTGLPEITSYTTTMPDCTTKSGTTMIMLVWTSERATEAWVNQPVTASTAGDPRTVTPHEGPLKPNGSLQLPFDCTQQYNYYNLAVYNPSTTQSGGQDNQVVNNLPFP